MKWLVFFIYWISLVYTMRQGDLWMWIILMPSFLLLYSWAEEQDQDNGPAAMDQHVCEYVCICAKMLSKCDLLTPAMRVEAATLAERDEMVVKSAEKCDKVWNCVTI